MEQKGKKTEIAMVDILVATKDIDAAGGNLRRKTSVQKVA